MKTSQVNLIFQASYGLVPAGIAEEFAGELAQRIQLDVTGFPQRRPDMYYSGIQVPPDNDLAPVRFGIYDTSIADDYTFGLPSHLVPVLTLEHHGDEILEHKDKLYVAEEPVAALRYRASEPGAQYAVAYAITNSDGDVTHTIGRTGTDTLTGLNGGRRNFLRRPSTIGVPSEIDYGYIAANVMKHVCFEHYARWGLRPLHAEDSRVSTATPQKIANQNLANLGVMALGIEKRLNAV